MRRTLALVSLTLVVSAAAHAQAVPDGSQATRVEPAYRRTPTFRNDPFRHVYIPHWGFVFSVGATAENNALNVADVRAVIFLQDRDSLLAGSLLDLIGLVPTGAGIRGQAQGEGGFYLGGPFGRHVSIGLSAQGRAYGSFLLDDDAVALLRDGNGARQSFSLGNTKASGLSTAEAGAHAMIRSDRERRRRSRSASAVGISARSSTPTRAPSLGTGAS